MFYKIIVTIFLLASTFIKMLFTQTLTVTMSFKYHPVYSILDGVFSVIFCVYSWNNFYLNSIIFITIKNNQLRQIKKKYYRQKHVVNIL